jgi:4-hydroxybenzoate polyprenyltransferase
MRIFDYGRMIKFSHSVFALPFAGASLILAFDHYHLTLNDYYEKFIWLLIAMISARSAAMGFNRIVDRTLDSQNVRTRDREIPAGIISVRSAALFVSLSSLLFLLSAFMLNFICFILAFPVLFILLGYSYTKRFWAGSHFILGLSLGIAPSGVWLALMGRLDIFPVLLSGAVALWTAGFDILYSIQDIEFDKQLKLKSIPAVYGIQRSVLISRLCHGLMLTILIILNVLLPAGLILRAGLVIIAFIIFHEHRLVSKGLENIDKAFFTMNGQISVLYFLFVLTDRIFLL